MDPDTLAALRGSVAKWERIVAGTDINRAIENCPLCAAFNHPPSHCRGCPVMDKTGQFGCGGTPYEEFEASVSLDGGVGLNLNDLGGLHRARFLKLAQAELDFLRSLLPPEDATP